MGDLLILEFAVGELVEKRTVWKEPRVLVVLHEIDGYARRVQTVVSATHVPFAQHVVSVKMHSRRSMVDALEVTEPVQVVVLVEFELLWFAAPHQLLKVGLCSVAQVGSEFQGMPKDLLLERKEDSR